MNATTETSQVENAKQAILISTRIFKHYISTVKKITLGGELEKLSEKDQEVVLEIFEDAKDSYKEYVDDIFGEDMYKLYDRMKAEDGKCDDDYLSVAIKGKDLRQVILCCNALVGVTMKGSDQIMNIFSGEAKMPREALVEFMKYTLSLEKFKDVLATDLKHNLPDGDVKRIKAKVIDSDNQITDIL